MVEVLNFVFQDFTHFVGCWFLLATLAGGWHWR